MAVFLVGGGQCELIKQHPNTLVRLSEEEEEEEEGRASSHGSCLICENEESKIRACT